MGRNMVRQEYREPGERSRLWLYEDIDHVLKNNTGTGNVQAIDIKGAKDTRIDHEEKEACWRPQGLAPLVTLRGWVLSALSWQGLALLVTPWGWVQKTLSWQGFTSSKKPEGLLWNPNAFQKMPNLKFLRIHNICHQFVPEYLPNKLTYLEWSNYPSKSLPCFFPNELVQLRLQCSKIELLWRGMKNFDKLKFIDMVGSLDLITTPDFDGVPNLEKLVFSSCSNLCGLHPSIGKLKKLEFLDLEGCQKLTSLPDKFEMESLVTLNLAHCSKVKKIPEFVGNMKLLQKLLLKSTAITTLPSSIECLTGLNFLTLRNCKQLVCLPNTICSLTSLNSLDLFGCSKFDKLQEDLGNIIWLEELWLAETAIKELPSSFVERLCFFESTEELPSQIGFLIGLTSLDLTNCKDFVLLPSTICSLKSLSRIRLSGCSKFVNLPENLGNLEGLTSLCLEGTAIELLPSSVGRLTTLWRLNLRDCKNLLCLPGSICSLKKLTNLDLSGCSKFVNLPENLGNLEGLIDLSLKRTAIEVLPSSIGRLTALNSLDIRDCKNLVCLPDNIGCLFSLSKLHLCGSNFISLPKSISQLSRITSLDLDGCKRLRSLPDFPSEVHYINVNNCTSLERFPECPKNCPFWCGHFNFNVECVNCFNLQISNNIPKGLGDTLERGLSSILPGKEIPNGFEKANIRYSSVLAPPSYFTYNYSVNIQLPISRIDDLQLQAIILCVVFVPCEHYNHPEIQIQSMYYNPPQIRIQSIKVNGGTCSDSLKDMVPDLKYGKFESHHLWLSRPSLPRDYWWCIDEKKFNEVEFVIATRSMVVEAVGFRLLNCYDSDYEDDLDMVIDCEKSSKEDFRSTHFRAVQTIFRSIQRCDESSDMHNDCTYRLQLVKELDCALAKAFDIGTQAQGRSGQSVRSQGGGHHGGGRVGCSCTTEPDPIYKEGDDSGAEESWLGTDWVLSDDSDRTPRCTSSAGAGPSHTAGHEDTVPTQTTSHGASTDYEDPPGMSPPVFSGSAHDGGCIYVPTPDMPTLPLVHVNPTMLASSPTPHEEAVQIEQILAEDIEPVEGLRRSRRPPAHAPDCGIGDGKD